MRDFVVPPVAQPVRTDDQGRARRRLLRLRPAGTSRPDPRRAVPSDDDLGVPGHHAGADDQGAPGHGGRRLPDQRAARRPPGAAATSPRPRRTSTARRRCRSSTATRATSRHRASQGLPVPRTSRTRGRSGTTTTASTTPRENAYMGLAAQYHLHDAARARAAAAARASSTCPLIVRDAMFGADGAADLRQQRVEPVWAT